MKFAGIALLLTGISPALATIRRILQAQAEGILEVISNMGRGPAQEHAEWGKEAHDLVAVE